MMGTVRLTHPSYTGTGRWHEEEQPGIGFVHLVRAGHSASNARATSLDKEG